MLFNWLLNDFGTLSTLSWSRASDHEDDGLLFAGHHFLSPRFDVFLERCVLREPGTRRIANSLPEKFTKQRVTFSVYWNNLLFSSTRKSMSRSWIQFFHFSTGHTDVRTPHVRIYNTHTILTVPSISLSANIRSDTAKLESSSPWWVSKSQPVTCFLRQTRTGEFPTDWHMSEGKIETALPSHIPSHLSPTASCEEWKQTTDSRVSVCRDSKNESGLNPDTCTV